MHLNTHFNYTGVMKNLFSKQLSLCVCILLSATPASGGSEARPSRLSPCPDSPNCVSSLSDNKKHFIEPFDFRGSREEVRQKLINILKSTRRVRLVKVETDFIHAEFRSFIFRFVDDVAFYFPSEETIIHVRSASRTGYYDFGANRRRVERLRSAFENRTK
jgi:uncharacterized protein (DUF1499 family)